MSLRGHYEGDDSKQGPKRGPESSLPSLQLVV